MKTGKRYKASWVLVCLILLLGTCGFPVQASGTSPDMNQILFLVDASQSMAEDEWMEARDCILAISSMLPSNYETAIIVYNGGIVEQTEFGQSIQEQAETLDHTERRGYTNTGLAVETALGQFSVEAVEKRVILFTDGEISMKGEEATQKAIELYDAAVKQAISQNVKIDMLIFPLHDMEEQILYGAGETGGFPYIQAGGDNAPAFVEEYLFGQLGLKRMMLGASDASSNRLEVSLQDTFMEQVKILLVSDGVIEDTQVACQSKEVQVVRGKYITVVDINAPVQEHLNLQYQLAEKGKINAYLAKEYRMSVGMETLQGQDAGQYTIEVSIEDAEGRAVLADANTQEKILICVNDNPTSYTVEQGKAIIPYTADHTQEVAVRVDFSGLNGTVFSTGEEGSLLLEMPPSAEQEEGVSYFVLYAVMAGIVGLFLLLSVIYIETKKKTKKSGTHISENKVINKIAGHDFSGQIVVYVLKCPGDTDIPPASINLYQREGREPFTFAWVKDKCCNMLQLEDADKIFFYGGENHTLYVKNSGNATICRGNNILLKNKKYQLSYNEKIFLIFNNGEAEMELYYKNIKPSERKG